MPPAKPLPVIVEPFSTFGDEIVGDTVEELARNLWGATRVSLAWRCKPRRPCPNVWELFRGHPATPQAELALREVAAVYERFRPKPNPPASEEQLAMETLF